MSKGVTLIRGGTLIDVRDGRQVEDCAIVVRDGRIDSVGRAGEVAVPSEAETIDASSKWVIPGLADLHAHVTSKPVHTELLGAYLANGVTTIRDTGGNLTKLRLLRDEIEAGRRVAPRLFFAGPIMDGKPPVWPDGSILIDTARRAESAVEFLVDQGVDFVKVYNNVPEESLRAVVRTAHARGVPVTGHVPRTITMRRAIDTGMDCLEHIRITGRELLPLEEANQIDFLPLPRREPLLWQRFSLQSPVVAELIARLAESRVVLVPTLMIDWAVFAGGLEDAEADRDDHGMPPDAMERVREDRPPDLYRVPAELKEVAREGFPKRQEFVRMCAEAGVRIGAGTDCFGPGRLLPGVSLQGELELLVQSGQSPLQALQAATLTAAAALKHEDELGTLEPGKRADLLVLEADPLRDIRNAARIDLVMKDGQIHRPAALLARQPAAATP